MKTRVQDKSYLIDYFALIAWLVCIHTLYVRRPRNMFSMGSPRNTHPPASTAVLPGAQPHRNGLAPCKDDRMIT